MYKPVHSHAYTVLLAAVYPPPHNANDHMATQQLHSLKHSYEYINIEDNTASLHWWLLPQL